MIASKLRHRIFEGRYPPGAPLRELTLARELEVSQATMREALQRLEYSGLVTRTPNVGTTVIRLSPRDIRQRVDLRSILEVKAGLEASPRMAETEFAELERRLAVMESKVATDSYYESAQADLEFHRWVWHCAGNEILTRVLEQVTVPLLAFISIIRSQGLQHLITVVDSHQPMIDALRSRDPQLIHNAFEFGAAHSYRNFFEGGPDQSVAAAFGYLDQVSAG